MDPFRSLLCQPPDRVVLGHPPLRHGVWGHPLRAGRAHLQRPGQLPEGGDDGVPGPSEGVLEDQPERQAEAGRDPATSLDEHRLLKDLSCEQARAGRTAERPKQSQCLNRLQ